MELSKRLKRVVSFVEPGAVVADVGTDHGYVPIFLVREGIAARALAMDVNRGPLLRAQAHVAAYGLTERIQLRLGDGLSALKAGEADTVILAGMGGPLMCRILTEGMELARTMKRLILSPQSELADVRAFLEQQGFAIVDEAMVEEDGKYYTVICARPACGKKYIMEDEGEQLLQRKYGACLLRRNDPVLREFLEREEKKYVRILDRLAAANGPDSAEGGRRAEREKEVKAELLLIRQALCRMESAGRSEAELN